MVEIILIEIVSLVAFLYSITLTFTAFTSISNMFIIFIWTIFISMIFALNYWKSKFIQWGILLILLPLIYIRSTRAIIFMIMMTVLIYLYIKESLLKGNHHDYAYKLKLSYITLILLASARFLLGGFTGSIAYAAPFIITYLMSSIVLTRSVRHLDSGMETKKIRRTNIIYLMFILITLAFSTIKRLREIGLSAAVKTMDIINMVVYYPIYLLYKIGEFIAGFFGQVDVRPEELQHLQNLAEENELVGEVSQAPELFPGKDFQNLRRVVGIIFIIIMIYIIYRIITKVGNRSYRTNDYLEEREFIEKPKKKRRLFRGEKYPITPNEQVRYYYRKFLRKLNKEDIEILKSDTSYDIGNKSKVIHGNGPKELREIYIKSRYSNRESSEAEVERAKEIYKNI